MEDIASDDDLLSDILVDGLEFDPKIVSNKMNSQYRSPRLDRAAISELVRRKVVIERDVPAAIEELCKIKGVEQHLARRTPSQRREFTTHARRYLDAYLPDSGFEFAVTYRYRRALAPVAASMRDASAVAESSAAGAAASATATSSSPRSASAASPSVKGKERQSGTIAGARLKEDLCVVALRPFMPNEIINCRGGVKDLTPAEDQALRSEVVANRGPARGEVSAAGSGRDFSIIKSTMRKNSQLLLGPARFVNHDCNPSVKFHREGTQMYFKVLRRIMKNEELLVGYGEHYFGENNCECLCYTCEEQESGAFAKPEVKTLQDVVASNADVEAEDGPDEAEADAGRRAPSKRLSARSPNRSGRDSPEDPTPDSPIAHSDREVDHISSQASRLLTCRTCRMKFLNRLWYHEDECRRCERHYKIFKADWPSRKPTEGSYADMAKAVEEKKRKANGEGEKSDASEAVVGPSKKKAAKAPAKKRIVTPACLRSSSDASDDVTSASSSIRLSPLRDVSDSGGKLAQKTLKARQPLLSRDSEDAASVDRVLAPTTVFSAPIGPFDDSSSELSEPISDSDTVTNHRSASQSSSRSASTADRPLGPKSLGKDAKTELLGSFWGSEGDSKRIRKPSTNGPISLASKVGHSRKSSGHQRSASSSSRAAATPTLLEETAADANGHQTSSAAKTWKTGKEDHPMLQSAAVPWNSDDTLSNSPHNAITVFAFPSKGGKPVPSPPKGDEKKDDEKKGDEKKGDEKKGGGKKSDEEKSDEEKSDEEKRAVSPQSRPSDATVERIANRADQTSPVSPAASTPAPNQPVLATQGPERTSIQNLAAYWSAGVEGTSRTRRQVQREPSMLSATSRSAAARASPKRRRDSADTSASNSPEVDNKRPKSRLSRNIDSNTSERRGSASPALSAPSSSRNQTPQLDNRSSQTNGDLGRAEEGKPQPQLQSRSSFPSALQNHPTVRPSPPHEQSQGPPSEPVSPHSWRGVLQKPQLQSSVSATAALPPSKGSPSGPTSGSSSFQTIPGRKNLRIGRSVSRPVPLPGAPGNSSVGTPPNGHSHATSIKLPASADSSPKTVKSTATPPSAAAAAAGSAIPTGSSALGLTTGANQSNGSPQPNGASSAPHSAHSNGTDSATAATSGPAIKLERADNSAGEPIDLPPLPSSSDTEDSGDDKVMKMEE